MRKFGIRKSNVVPRPRAVVINFSLVLLYESNTKYSIVIAFEQKKRNHVTGIAGRFTSRLSGVGGGASGASADAPTVGHRWQSDTHSLKKKEKKRRKRRRRRKGG